MEPANGGVTPTRRRPTSARLLDLTQALTEIEQHVGRIRDSTSWRFGRLLVSLYSRLARRPPSPTSLDRITALLDRALASLHESWIPAAQLDRSDTGGGTEGDRARASAERVALLCESRRIKDTGFWRHVNVIVYSAGRRDLLRRTLLSLRAHLALSPDRLFVIDDGDGDDGLTEQQLAAWIGSLDSIEIVPSARRRGFFRAVRAVMDQERHGDFCVLREGVVVTAHWLEKIRRAAYSSVTIGVATPITQTHPHYELTVHGGDNLLTCNRKLELVSGQEYPALAVPDLDVFYVKRAALQDDLFPGYGEGYDPLVRFATDLLDSGLITVAADDTYVHVPLERRATAAAGCSPAPAFCDSGKAHLARAAVAHCHSERPTVVERYERTTLPILSENVVTVMCWSLVRGGGCLVVAELINDLLLQGIDARAVLLNGALPGADFGDLLFTPFVSDDEDAIAERIPAHSSLVATFWPTAAVTARLGSRRPGTSAYYFIQDFEALFYDKVRSRTDCRYAIEAQRSYELPLEHLTSSTWIANQVRDCLADPSHTIRKIRLGLDHEIFSPKERSEAKGSLRIIAMARPRTPRRGFEDLVEALTLVHRSRAEVEIALFGATSEQLGELPFPYLEIGPVSRPVLREQYCAADVFVDSSLFQGFGLSALEAMACGCACVLTDSGGIGEYAEPGVNCLVTAPSDPTALAAAVIQLLQDPETRLAMAAAGQRTARRFDVHDTASDLAAILHQRNQRKRTALEAMAAEAVPNVIIPVHNQLSVTRRCLESVLRNTTAPYRVYVVDDASDRHTSRWLEAFAREHGHVHYLRNDSNLGFVASVNAAMAATRGGDLVLLNNDTVVTPDWLDELATRARSDASVGIVSPLSNASSHLWVTPNPGDTIYDVAAAIKAGSGPHLQDVVTPEGWCLYIKRAVYELLGGFDPIYGRGYCEESDYSLRALVNRYRLACCESCFVYHEGSATFEQERTERYRDNRAIFDARYAPLYQKHYRQFLRDNPLDEVRRRYGAKRGAARRAAELQRLPSREVIAVLDDPAIDRELALARQRAATREPLALPVEDLRITFLLSTLEPFGGVLSVVQLANDLVLRGMDVKVVVLNPKGYDSSIEMLTAPLLFPDDNSLLEHFPASDVVVSSLWITVYYMARLLANGQRFVPSYFVQDFEPYFYASDDPLRERVRRTYELTPNCFAKSKWLCDRVRRAGGQIRLVPPGLDLDVFYPRDVEAAGEKKILLAMLRPRTPQRGLETLAAVVAALAASRDDFELHAFGSSDDELAAHGINFPLVNHGPVANARLPRLYSAAYAYLDFSSFHGFGRTVAEAMACGTPAVVTASGGVEDFCRADENCLVAAVGDVPGLVAQVSRLLDEPRLRAALGARCRESVTPFDRRLSAERTLAVLGDFARGTGATPRGTRQPIEIRI